MAKTPKEFTRNLKNKVLTQQMLESCIFSCNKRAKNCRDKARKYRNIYDRYNNAEKYEDAKNEYYNKKEILLSLLKPVCIHKEEKKINSCTRFYSYEDDYYEIPDDEVIYQSSYFDKDMGECIDFKDIYEDETIINYYLFYKTPEKSFHTPICETDIDKYPGLEIVDIGELRTFGTGINDLVSVQFCNAVIDLVKSNDYILEEKYVF